MPKLVLAVFCEQAIVDQFTNNLSIINQLDELQLPRARIQTQLTALSQSKTKKPRLLVPHRCTLVTLWEREKPSLMESTEINVRLIAPDGTKLVEMNGPLNLRKHRRWRSLMGLPGLPTSGEGTYEFQIRIRRGVKWALVRRVTYQLSYRDVPDPGPAQRRLN